MLAKNGEGGGRLRVKIVVGGGTQGKNGKWEAGGRAKVLVGGGKEGKIRVGGKMSYPCVSHID